jgi:hypothetical protein
MVQYAQKTYSDHQWYVEWLQNLLQKYEKYFILLKNAGSLFSSWKIYFTLISTILDFVSLLSLDRHIFRAGVLLQRLNNHHLKDSIVMMCTHILKENEFGVLNVVIPNLFSTFQ